MNLSHPHQFFGSLVAVAAILFVALGDAFLLAWHIEAGPRDDIAARGGFLLALFLPIIAVVVAAVMVVLGLFAGHRHGVRVFSRILTGIGATLLAYVMLYLSPFDLAWVIISPVRRLIGLPGSIVVDLVLLAIALRFAFKRDNGTVLKPEGFAGAETGLSET